MASGSDLVTFNVGGKIYQVLREPTLSLHPNSLLTQLAEDKQDDKEIFVEGPDVSKGGALHNHAYVLNSLRLVWRAIPTTSFPD